MYIRFHIAHKYIFYIKSSPTKTLSTGTLLPHMHKLLYLRGF